MIKKRSEHQFHRINKVDGKARDIIIKEIIKYGKELDFEYVFDHNNYEEIAFEKKPETAEELYKEPEHKGVTETEFEKKFRTI